MVFRSVKVLQVGLLVAGLSIRIAHGQEPAPAKSSMATPDRWNDAGWWPTKGTPSLSEYAGPDACTRCHAEIAASQRLTPMFNAAHRPSVEALHKQKELRFEEDNYSYVLWRESDELKFLVKDRTNAVASGTVDWVFGEGEESQTYVLRQKDTFLESRLSYYSSLAGLDLTPGHPSKPPRNIAEVIGTPVSDEIIRRCFGCHSTASTVSGKFDPEHAMLGVTCEACHGPGLEHVTAMQTSQHLGAAAGTILNPERLAPVDSVDFCGACHRTPVDVAVFMPRHMGVSETRFQPYRLERSLCWGAGGDSRITCMACHDPHKPLERRAAAYDAKCLKCHAAGRGAPASAKLAPACPAGAKECSSCHMPKIEIPWVHAAFTDHFIRIARPGAPFPE